MIGFSYHILHLGSNTNKISGKKRTNQHRKSLKLQTASSQFKDKDIYALNMIGSEEDLYESDSSLEDTTLFNEYDHDQLDDMEKDSKYNLRRQKLQSSKFSMKRQINQFDKFQMPTSRSTRLSTIHLQNIKEQEDVLKSKEDIIRSIESC